MSCTALPRRALKYRPGMLEPDWPDPRGGQQAIADPKISETRSDKLALRLLFRLAKRLGYALVPLEVLGLPGDRS